MATFDYFLRLDGIPGESVDDKHKGEIDVLSWSWGESQEIAEVLVGVRGDPTNGRGAFLEPQAGEGRQAAGHVDQALPEVDIHAPIVRVTIPS